MPNESTSCPTGWRLWFFLAKQTVSEGLDDNIPRLGAALAFYALLSLVPMLVLLASVASTFYGSDVTRQQIYEIILRLAGTAQANTIRDMLDGVSQHAEVNSVTAIFSSLILLYGASGFFTQLKDGLNIIWKLPPYAGNAFIHMLKENLFSLLTVVAIGVLTIVAILANTLLGIMIQMMVGALPTLAAPMEAVNYLLNFCVLACLFACAFKFIPSRKIAWRDVRYGALLTAMFFTAGQYLIGFYLGHASFIAGYGAAGSLVALLVWIYFCVQIFFFGASFCHIYAIHVGSYRKSKI